MLAGVTSKNSYQKMDSKTPRISLDIAIVYVALGPNPQENFDDYLSFTRDFQPQAKYFMITDDTHRWKDFPGKVISYSQELRSSEFKNFVKKNSYLQKIAGGYWLFTLERLFALKLIEEYVDGKTLVIHLESDVVLMSEDQEIDLIKHKIEKVSIPRYSESEGIASILISRNKEELVKCLIALEKLLSENPKTDNDMALLGLALNQGLVDELPSFNGSKWLTKNGNRIIFDGLAFGQYLLGRYPLHSDNKVIRGYSNPFHEMPLNEGLWTIQNQKKITLNLNSITYQIANLHIHSKVSTPLISENVDFWNNVLLEANGLVPHNVVSDHTEAVHVGKYSILTKYRIIKRNGVAVYLKRKLHEIRQKF